MISGFLGTSLAPPFDLYSQHGSVIAEVTIDRNCTMNIVGKSMTTYHH